MVIRFLRLLTLVLTPLGYLPIMLLERKNSGEFLRRRCLLMRILVIAPKDVDL